MRTGTVIARLLEEAAALLRQSVSPPPMDEDRRSASPWSVDDTDENNLNTSNLCAQLGTADYLGWSLLHFAAANGDIEQARKLVREDPALLDATTPALGFSALHLAVIGWKENMVIALLELDTSGHLIRTKTERGQTPFELARENSLDDIAALLEAHLTRTAQAQRTPTHTPAAARPRPSFMSPTQSSTRRTGQPTTPATTPTRLATPLQTAISPAPNAANIMSKKAPTNGKGKSRS